MSEFFPGFLNYFSFIIIMKSLLFTLFLLLVLGFFFFKKSKPLPVFNNLKELEVSPWKDYFLQVYKELPDESDFPIRIEDFSILYKGAPIDPPGYIKYLGWCPSDEGKLYNNMSVTNDPPNTTWIYHSPPFKPLKGLVEVTHCADSFVTSTETLGMWMYHAPGSGIYFDLGRTIVFNYHKDAIQYFLNKKCTSWSWLHGNIECDNDFTSLITEAKKDYDSIQFLNHEDMRCGNMAVEIIALNYVGDYPCGNESGKGLFKTGWKGSKECICDPTKLCLNCNN